MSEVTMKSTKQQIFDALQAAQTALAERESLTEDPMKEKKAEEAARVIEGAEKAVESNIFNPEITQQYTDLTKAIADKKQELNELYGIEARAKTLVALINASKEKDFELKEDYKAKKAELEAEYTQKIVDLKTEVEALKQEKEVIREEIIVEAEEERALVEKERKREEEEYAYQLKRDRKKDEDDWNDIKIAREKTVALVEQAAKNMLEEATAKQKEFDTLQEQVAEFPNLLLEAEKAAEKKGKEKAGKEYAFEKNALVKENEYEVKRLTDKLNMMEESLEAEKIKNAELQDKLDAAYIKMNALASETVKSSGGVRILSSETQAK